MGCRTKENEFMLKVRVYGCMIQNTCMRYLQSISDNQIQHRLAGGLFTVLMVFMVTFNLLL